MHPFLRSDGDELFPPCKCRSCRQDRQQFDATQRQLIRLHAPTAAPTAAPAPRWQSVAIGIIIGLGAIAASWASTIFQ